MSNEKIASINTTNYNQSPQLLYNNERINLFFSGDLSKQDKVTYNHGSIINIYVVYKLSSSVSKTSLTLKNCLFAAVALTKNSTDITRCNYSGYGIAFNSQNYLH